MTIARSELVDLDATPYYHCMARCVRRAFLCGEDEYSGRNFDHRKLWIIERIKLLASIFAIDVCAYAILSNHLHLILRVMARLIAEWSDEKVLSRVRLLCPTCVEGIESYSEDQRQELITEWRERLSSISWFMAKLDEYIARRANKEDGCTGRFWEGRFKSQALMDDGALLSSMAYVDLNPVRAGIAEGLDDSSWTSIQQRLREVAASMAQDKKESSKTRSEPSEVSSKTQPAASTEVSSKTQSTESVEERTESQPEPRLEQCPELAPMYDDGSQSRRQCLPLSLLQYIELLEWTGRAVRKDKRGHITSPPTQLLAMCGLDPERWLESVERFGSLGGFVGHPRLLRQRATQVGRRWFKGQGVSSTAYLSAA